MLQEPRDQGGYGTAGLVQIILGWSNGVCPQVANVGQCRCSHSTGGSPSGVLRSLALFRGTKSDLPMAWTIKATIRAWGLAVKLASPSYQGISPSTPIWINHILLHFYNLPDPIIWAVKGIKTLKDITSYGDRLTFSQLKTRHDLPNSYLFRLFQLRHAYQTQFGELRVETLPSALESLLSTEDLNKVLSLTSKEFFKSTPRVVTNCREKWETEVPNIQGEDWDDLWTQPFKHLVSARDRLIQFKFLHRSY